MFFVFPYETLYSIRLVPSTFLGYNKGMETDREFKIGEHVVYPLQGVGIVREIKERQIKDQTRTYYVIYIDVSDMVVNVPVDNAQATGIRHLVSPAEAKAAIESISDKYEPVNVDWKARYQLNMNLIKEGSINSITKVVQGLYHRSKIKELPVQERKLYDNALRLLIDECSFSLNKSPDEIEKEIFRHLEK